MSARFYARQLLLAIAVQVRIQALANQHYNETSVVRENLGEDLALDSFY